MPASRPRRHHLVPELLLRRFAERNRLMMVARDTGAVVQTSPTNAGVQTDFYRVETSDKSDAYQVEGLLSRVEGYAASALKSIDRGEFPPNRDDREALAMFISFQMQRGTHLRALMEEAYTETARMMFRMYSDEHIAGFLREQEGRDPTEEEVREIRDALDTVRIVPHQNDAVLTMLKVAMDLTPPFLQKRWVLATFDGLRLLTSDNPVGMFGRRDPRRPLDGVGIANAEYIVFPLDPSRAILLLPGTGHEGVLRLPASQGKGFNQTIARLAHRWIFHNPGHDPMRGVALPPRGRHVFSGLGPRTKTAKR